MMMTSIKIVVVTVGKMMTMKMEVKTKARRTDSWCNEDGSDDYGNGRQW